VWYITCTAWRLARFNTAAAAVPTSGFRGLPSPAAAGTVASFVILVETVARFPVAASPVPPHAWAGPWLAAWMSAGLAFLGWLMISNTPYVGLKGLDLKRPKPLQLALTLVTFGFVLWSLPQLLFGLCLVYIFLGLALRFLTQVRWAEVVAPELVAWAEQRMAPREQASPSPARLSR
jgi:CDP-diacylglycerol--serine O-phosphatidyltransferase